MKVEIDKRFDGFPAHLSDLLRKQQEDGKWAAEPATLKAIQSQGFIPDAPSGISEWRWISALAVAVMRRYPELYSRLEGFYTKAMFHVNDPCVAEYHQTRTSLVRCPSPSLSSGTGILSSARQTRCHHM